MAAPCRQRFDHHFFFIGLALPVAVGQAGDFVIFGHIQVHLAVDLVEGQPVRPVQPAGEGLRFARNAVIFKYYHLAGPQFRGRPVADDDSGHGAAGERDCR